MARLSDLQLASLLDEMACSMRVGAPIADSMRRLKDRRLGSIARAAELIAERLERGESLPASLAAIDSPMSDQVSATLQACQQSADFELLSCMARQLRQRSEYVRSVRFAWIYPLLLIAIGYAVGVRVMGPTVLKNGGVDFAWPASVVASAQWLESYWYWPPIVMAIGLGLLIVRLSSRHRLPSEARRRLFCQSLADQISHNTAEGVAIRTAAQMSGDQLLESIEEPTFQSPSVQTILCQAGSGRAADLGAKELIISQLRYMAAVYENRMRRRCFVWARLVPRLVMIVFGGGMILAYVLCVIAPVYRQVVQW